MLMVESRREMRALVIVIIIVILAIFRFGTLSRTVPTITTGQYWYKVCPGSIFSGPSRPIIPDATTNLHPQPLNNGAGRGWPGCFRPSVAVFGATVGLLLECFHF
jgi:hypothetical protein